MALARCQPVLQSSLGAPNRHPDDSAPPALLDSVKVSVPLYYLDIAGFHLCNSPRNTGPVQTLSRLSELARPYSWRSSSSRSTASFLNTSTGAGSGPIIEATT